MLRSRLFFRLFFAIFGLVAVAVISTAVVANRWRYSEELGSDLLQYVVLLLAAAAAVVYLVVRCVVGPLQQLGCAARSIAAGEYGERVPVRGNDELGELARSFNRISGELGSQLSQLRESDERQAAVLGGMVEGVLAVDDKLRVLFANPAAADLLGFAPQSVEGRPLLEVVRQHVLHETVLQVLEDRESTEIEIEWQIGAPRTLSVQIAPLPGAQNVGAVIVLHDNTELRRLETIRQEFIANVSHELKTPLSSIMAYTETLQRGALDDRDIRDEFLRRISEQGERLNNLIQDMLSLARIETAKQPFEIVPVDLATVARSCVDDYTAQAEAKNLKLTIAADLPSARVSADQEGLRVICSNLIDNAVKYTPDGGKVDVFWRLQAEVVRFEVVDSGPGISRADVDRVFERFFRVDKARSRELGSTGLGLAIVKHLAQSFGGAVGVESQVGQGSRFWVELPAVNG